jgi:hypothetical protein
LFAVSLPAGLHASTRTIDQHQAAEPQGSVEIINVAGSIQVSGWDKPEVSVTGEIGERVERVELTGSGNRTTLRVILPSGNHWGGDGSARLTVHVPKASALEVSLVASDLDVAGVSGAQQLRTVSGGVRSVGGAAARINTVSGAVNLSVANQAGAEVESISGDLTVEGAGGDVSVQTVSGNGRLALGSVAKLRLRTVAGKFSISASLAAGARLEGESVSGDLTLALKNAPGAEFDLQTLSGDITNCDGPGPQHPTYGPGSRLRFTSGDGKAEVHLSSKSGNLDLCTR